MLTEPVIGLFYNLGRFLNKYLFVMNCGPEVCVSATCEKDVVGFDTGITAVLHSV